MNKTTVPKILLTLLVSFTLHGCLAVGGGGGKSGSLPVKEENISQLQVGKTSYEQAIVLMGLPVEVENCCGTTWTAKWQFTDSGGMNVSVGGIGASGSTAATSHVELYFNPKTKILNRIERYQTQISSGGVGM
jgi:outer membrane protein assembly factor BamE (lipoprotein component of BamABCDE complex)